MITIKKTMLAIACFAMLLQACNTQKTEVAPNNLNTSDVSVKNGALHFKNLDAFVKIVNQLNDGDLNLETWPASIGFENSLRKSEKENALDVPDPVFATVLNTDGVYFIGDEAHRVTAKYEYSTKAQNVDQLLKIAIDSEDDKISGVKAHKIIFGAAAEKFNAQNVRFQGLEPRIKYVYRNRPVPYATRYDLRAVLEAWSRTYVFYSSVGIRIKGEKEEKGGLFNKLKWRENVMDYAYINYEARTKSCINGNCTPMGTVSDMDFKYNVSELSITIDKASGTSAWHVTEYIKGDFAYSNIGWEVVEWNNEVFD